MQTLRLKDTELGDFIKLTPTSPTVWIRGLFDRNLGKYSIEAAEYRSPNAPTERMISGNKMVWVGFTY